MCVLVKRRVRVIDMWKEWERNMAERRERR
jgi:hypothetical protein